MHKTILVLEESQMVHDLFESALPDEFSSWTIEHESNPDNFLSKSEETNPDIIFLSNQDQKRDYLTVKEIKASHKFADTPILLLTSAKDRFDEQTLQGMGVRGFVRKPFEMATLQRQINTVLRDQEKARKKSGSDELKDFNIIDDELLELMPGKEDSEVTLDSLEVELDPTLQLIPEEDELDEELAETELMSMDASDEIDQVDFIEDEPELDDDFSISEPEELPHHEIDDEDFDAELDQVDDEADFSAIDDFEVEAIDVSDRNDTPVKAISSITVIQDPAATPKPVLTNTPDDPDELGFMELDVIPLRGTQVKSSVVETIDDDFDSEKFVEDHSPAELEEDFSQIGSDFDLDSAMTDKGDEIEIPHEEIVEDFYEGEDDDDSLEVPPFQELSIEGMDEGVLIGDSDEEDAEDLTFVEQEPDEDVVFEELESSDETLEETNIQQIDFALDDSGDEDELLTLKQETDELEDDQTSLLEQTDAIDIEVDFEEEEGIDEIEVVSGHVLFEQDDEDLEEEDLSENDLEKRQNDQLDIDLEEIAAAGSEEASATIQEMIGFRQVMKAKYDIPEMTSDEQSEDDADDDLEMDLLDDGIGNEDDDLLPLDEDMDSDVGLDLVDDGGPLEVPEDEPLLRDEVTLEEDDDIDLLEEVEQEETEDDINIIGELEEDEDDDVFSDGEESEDQLDEINLLGDDEEDLDSDLADDDLLSEDLEEPSDAGDILDMDSPAIEEEPLDNSFQEDDIFESADDLDTSFEDPDDGDDLLSEPPEDALEEPETTDDSFEEIELLTDIDNDEADDTDILSTDDLENIEPIDDSDLSEEDDLLEMDLGEQEDLIEDTTEELMQMDSGISVEEIDIESDDSGLEPEEEAASDSDSDIDDIDFLPVDEDDSMIMADDVDTDEVAEIPLIDDELESDDSSTEPSVDDIDFLPVDDEDSQTALEEDISSGDDLVEDDMSALDSADEMTIEVPQETFEMGDFNINDITEEDDLSPEEPAVTTTASEESDKIDLMDGIDTVSAGDDEEQESLDDIDLPSMDEELPDLPPIVGSEELDEDEVVQEDADEFQLMQNEDDFEDFPGEGEIIGEISDELSPEDGGDEKSTDLFEEAMRAENLQSSIQETTEKSIPSSLSPEFRNRLSNMIEGVISETVHNTLKERLPDMVDQLMNEEVEEK